MKGGKEKEIDIFHGTHMLHFCNMNMVVEFPDQMIIEILELCSCKLINTYFSQMGLV